MKSLGNFPDPFIAETSGQLDAIRRATAAVSAVAGHAAPPVFVSIGSSSWRVAKDAGLEPGSHVHASTVTTHG